MDTPKDKKNKKKNISEKEDLEELAQFRKKKKIQNEALNKILQEFDSSKEKMTNK